jgi:hypothetical protein
LDLVRVTLIGADDIVARRLAWEVAKDPDSADDRSRCQMSWPDDRMREVERLNRVAARIRCSFADWQRVSIRGRDGRSR